MRHIVSLLLLCSIMTVSAHDLIITEPPACQSHVSVEKSDALSCDTDSFCVAHTVMHQAILNYAFAFDLPDVRPVFEAFEYHPHRSSPLGRFTLQPPRSL